MALNNTSTAKEIATAVGCSQPTIMKKAKDLDIKFKGRTDDEHTQLMGALSSVRCYSRKTSKKNGSRKSSIADRIAKHLEEGKMLLEAARDELLTQEKQAVELHEQIAKRKAAIVVLEGEQQVFVDAQN